MEEINKAEEINKEEEIKKEEIKKEEIKKEAEIKKEEEIKKEDCYWRRLYTRTRTRTCCLLAFSGNLQHAGPNYLLNIT